MILNFGHIPQLITELGTLEHLEKSMYIAAIILVPSFLIGSSLFLQVNMKYIKLE